MNVNIAIDEKTITDEIVRVLVENGVKQTEKDLFDAERGSYMRRVYKEHVQGVIRDMIKAHADDIIDRAVVLAAEIIARKGLPKLLEKV